MLLLSSYDLIQYYNTPFSFSLYKHTVRIYKYIDPYLQQPHTLAGISKVDNLGNIFFGRKYIQLEILCEGKKSVSKANVQGAILGQRVLIWPHVSRKKMAHLHMKAWKNFEAKNEGKQNRSSTSFNRKSFITTSR